MKAKLPPIGLKTLVSNLLAYLPGYTAKYPNNDNDCWSWADLVATDKTRPSFGLSYDKREDRIKFHADYEGHLGYNESIPWISVSARKSGEQIAKDISRRLMDPAARFHTRRQKEADADRQYKEGRIALAEELAKQMGVKVEETGQDKDHNRIYLRDTGYIYVYGPDSVELKFYRITANQARKLATVLPFLHEKE